MQSVIGRTAGFPPFAKASHRHLNA